MQAPDLALVSPVASGLVTLALIAWMLGARNRLPLDVPNERSLHSRPVPRSGGIAMMAGIFVGFALMQTPLAVVVPAAVLVAFSHLDDARGLPVPLRLGVQLVAASGFAYAALPQLGLPLIALGIARSPVDEQPVQLHGRLRRARRRNDPHRLRVSRGRRLGKRRRRA